MMSENQTAGVCHRRRYQAGGSTARAAPRPEESKITELNISPDTTPYISGIIKFDELDIRLSGMNRESGGRPSPLMSQRTAQTFAPVRSADKQRS